MTYDVQTLIRNHSLVQQGPFLFMFEQRSALPGFLVELIQCQEALRVQQDPEAR